MGHEEAEAEARPAAGRPLRLTSRACSFPFSLFLRSSVTCHVLWGLGSGPAQAWPRPSKMQLAGLARCSLLLEKRIRAQEEKSNQPKRRDERLPSSTSLQRPGGHRSHRLRTRKILVLGNDNLSAHSRQRKKSGKTPRWHQPPGKSSSGRQHRPRQQPQRQAQCPARLPHARSPARTPKIPKHP